jgi:hypothetical protein
MGTHMSYYGASKLQVRQKNPQPKNSLGFKFGGGDKQDRTADLLHAMQALSQLSYTPTGKTSIIASSHTNCQVRNSSIFKALLRGLAGLRLLACG